MLRSDAWIVGDSEVAVEHRVALRSAGIAIESSGGKPIIGIANSASDLNPCNLPFRSLATNVKEGVMNAGGIPVEFPCMSLGEDLMKPTAMLYRNLLAMEIEEMARAHPLDGLVLLANCDKTIPGALMGALSADLPTLVVTCGSRRPATLDGARLASGTDLWRQWDERRSERADDQAWDQLESALNCGPGACNSMGTASTMAVMSEILGFMLPGASTIPTNDPRSASAARDAGKRIVRMVAEETRPSRVCTAQSFRNALRVLNAIGGSTNVLIHLAALAGRLGLEFDQKDADTIGRDIPLLLDVQPSGSGLMQDFDAAGGVPALLGALREMLESDSQLANGESMARVIDKAPPPSGVIRTTAQPLRRGGAFRIVQGNLAPDGAAIKISAASQELLLHRGRAVVFEGYEDMLRRIDDPGLEVDATSVLVLRNCGPVGGPGMPEWGMIPIPAKLLRAGVRDMVRISDARMSGTSYGTVVLHVAPESSVGGPLALVCDGDEIQLDADSGQLDLVVDDAVLQQRASSAPRRSPPLHLRGWPALYAAHVLQAPDGCDFDFLVAPTSAHRHFVEPVIGRS